MRKRFAYKSDDLYQQITVDEPFFKGVACVVKLQNVAKPKYIDHAQEKLFIIDNDYSLIEAYPDNSKYALTIMFDDSGSLIDMFAYANAISFALQIAIYCASQMRYDIYSYCLSRRDISRRRYIASPRDISQIPQGIYIAVGLCPTISN